MSKRNPEFSEQSIETYLAQLAARTSTPGGGSATALTAASAAALMSMVVEFTKESAAFSDIRTRAENNRSILVDLAERDAVVFDEVMRTYKTGTDAERQHALEQAASVPRQLIELTLPLVDDLEKLEVEGNKNLISDVAISARLLSSAFHASELNILINVSAFPEADSKPVFLEVLKTLPGAIDRLDAIASRVTELLKSG